ncbi:Abl interactor 1 [Cichlidogyrus casuarinus]|uniref:Abl interactor 1 n=1 Tax=Cichlidogyrus casuarinus TaxID=1844966 RepID=A0ABD2Q2L1_9PLAT
MRPIEAILGEDLPRCQDNIFKTANEIDQAAKYCRDAYLRSRNKAKSLDETLNYATESLEKVAGSLDNLAKHFLTALDQQNDMLNDICEDTSRLKLFLNAHREKVARKAIGTCTVEKSAMNYSNDYQPEVIQKYIRRPIDYSLFDGIGFGCTPVDRSRKRSEPVPVGHMQPHGSVAVRRSSAAVPPIYDRQNSHLSQTVGPKSSTEYAASTIYNASRVQQGSRAGAPIYAQQQNQALLSRNSSSSSADVSGYASRNAVMVTSQPTTTAAISHSRAATLGPQQGQMILSQNPTNGQQFVIQAMPGNNSATIGHTPGGRVMLVQSSQQNSNQQPLMFLRQQSEVIPSSHNNQAVIMSRPNVPIQRQHSLNTPPQPASNVYLARTANQEPPVLINELSRVSSINDCLKNLPNPA